MIQAGFGGCMLFSKSAVEARQLRVSKAVQQLLNSDEAIAIFCGDPITKPGGLDQTYSFIPHPMYLWLSGRSRKGEVSIFVPGEGWKHFQNPMTDEELVWEGEQIPTDSSLKLTDLKLFLDKNKHLHFYPFGQVPQILPEGMIAAKSLEKQFRIKTQLDQTRRIKDAEEVQLIQRIAGIANKGYQKLSQIIRPGISERQIQIEFEAEIFRAGAEKVPYETIVGTGSHSAILHAIPSQRMVQSGDLVLIDAGADISDYCVDITRVFFADREMSIEQKHIYDTVKNAHEQCISMCKPGTQWKHVHQKSAEIIAEGLKMMGVLKCSVSEALETEAISVFYPHGVGHLVGLRVRDTGCEENLDPKKYFGARLRVDLSLSENMLLTVEPGCYFIESLIQSSQVQKKYKDQISFEKAQSLLGLGGVRLEDDILVQNEVPRNLTEIVPFFDR